MGATPVTKMLGGDLLAYLRDELNEIAAKKRGFAQQSIAISGGQVGEEELREIGVIEAASDCIQYALAVGQDAKAKGRAQPEWLIRMIQAARLSLVSLKP